MAERTSSAGSQRSSSKNSTEGWSEQRIQVREVLKSTRFDGLMGCVIGFNVVLMLVEADVRASCWPDSCNNAVVLWLNRILLVFYTGEASARFYVERRRYWSDRWNCLDFFIVTFGYIDEVITLVTDGGDLPAAQMMPMLRILRIARLMRAIRLLRFYPELYILVRGFLGAMRAMFWGFVLIVMLLVLWSLVSVELIHPINMEMLTEARKTDPDAGSQFCEAAFSSVFDSAIVLFQTLVAGDSWGQCILPIIHYQKITFFIFAMALVSVSLGFMNLILAVIVDHAAAARDGDKEEKVKEKKKEEAAALARWKDLIRQIDQDQDGSITFDELLSGYEVPEVYETLGTMGISRDDLVEMFRLMDSDGSGDLDYDEFIDAFIKAQGQDLRIYLMMTRLQCNYVANSVNRIKTELGIAPAGEEAQNEEAPVPRKASIATASTTASTPEAPRAAPEPSAEAAPAPPSSVAVSFEADFKGINEKLSQQFDQLARRIELNTMTLAQQSEVLEVMLAQFDKPATLHAQSKPFPNAVRLEPDLARVADKGVQTNVTARRSISNLSYTGSSSELIADNGMQQGFNGYSDGGGSGRLSAVVSPVIHSEV